MSNNHLLIENVYQATLQQTFQKISQLVKKYKYIAVDTEFPGFFTDIALLNETTSQHLKPTSDYWRQFVYNIQSLKLIQFGIAFCDERGNYPFPASYQFNFSFDIDKDPCEPQSRAFINESFSKADWEGLRFEGIDVAAFSAAFLSSGLIQNNDLQWFVFHGNQDMGYLVKNLINYQFNTLQEFKQTIKQLFPNVYDLKFQYNCSLTMMGINENIQRVGNEHQAGSDALLTLKCGLRQLQQKNNMHKGEVYGFDKE